MFINNHSLTEPHHTVLQKDLKNNGQVWGKKRLGWPYLTGGVFIVTMLLAVYALVLPVGYTPRGRQQISTRSMCSGMNEE